MIPRATLRAPDQRRPPAHDAEVAGERELAAAPEGVTGDLGDDRLRQALDAEERALGKIDAGRGGLGREVRIGERLELGARHEDLLVRAREHDHADARVGLEQVEEHREVGMELGVEGVRRRLVEDAAGDGVVPLDREEPRVGGIGIQTLVW